MLIELDNACGIKLRVGVVMSPWGTIRSSTQWLISVDDEECLWRIGTSETPLLTAVAVRELPGALALGLSTGVTCFELWRGHAL